MKNIFTLKTDQKSNLYYNTNDKCFQVSEVLKDSTPLKENQFVYVTNEESLTLGGYHFNSKYGDEPQKTNERDINWRKYWEEEDYEISKIVLTNDPQLVADGVQEINSSFLSFFAENKPEYVEVKEEIRAFDIQNDEVPYAIFDGDCTKTVYSLNFAEKDKKEEYSNTQKKSLEANKQFIKNTSPEKLEELLKEFDNYETETLEEAAEKWVDIVNFEGLYQISDFGNVKSLSRTITKGNISYTTKDRILKQSIDSVGYPCVNLSDYKKQKTFRVHQLVAISFLNHKPDRHKGLVIDHINGNKLNNNLTNLQLITNKINTSKDRKNKTSKYTGVSWHKQSNKWLAQFRENGSVKYLGTFETEEEARDAYNASQKRSYSKEEVINALHSVELKDNKDYSKIYKDMEKWLEQNKKK